MHVDCFIYVHVTKSITLLTNICIWAYVPLPIPIWIHSGFFSFSSTLHEFLFNQLSFFYPTRNRQTGYGEGLGYFSSTVEQQYPYWKWDRWLPWYPKNKLINAIGTEKTISWNFILSLVLSLTIAASNLCAHLSCHCKGSTKCPRLTIVHFINSILCHHISSLWQFQHLY